MLSEGLFWVQDRLTDFFMWMHAQSGFLRRFGLLRCLSRIGLSCICYAPTHGNFLSLFTLLEDFGYLPRVAFNLDHYFKKGQYGENKAYHVYGIWLHKRQVW